MHIQDNPICAFKRDSTLLLLGAFAYLTNHLISLFPRLFPMILKNKATTHDRKVVQTC